MRDEARLPIDPLRLWNTAVAVMADGIPLPRRGRATLVVTAEDPPQTGPVFLLDTAAGPIFAELRHLPLGAMTQSGLDMAALSRLPPDLSGAILTHALNLLLAEAGEAARARLRSITRSEAAQMKGEERLLLRLEGLWPEPAEIALQADRAVFSTLLLDLLPAAPHRPLPDALAARITLPCTLRLAGRDLALARLRSLSPGDILLLATAAPVLHAPQAAFALHHDGTRWTIGPLAMNDDLPPAPPLADQTATDLGEVPIRLSFVLADHLLTLADLQTLTPGAHLPLDPVPATAGQPVRILANGRQIGDGHVVEVEGQPAIRIARLFGG
ncbi:hypothetical protein C0V75_18110 [Tabrizicola sp. TH137]|uniref:FliM/FliN family flagellar motor switch protein n=1 Tax=Tabrizicola sp. TH137 TaxID=2067452 RepID=UPI000C7BA7DE|nr:FliM/FliN family flagellar motor switch protein [Tabrizicola sp. TH137]PLL11194.1 hypothetical protein C0V75_18110 [Tabrizicola sp. TH137]